MMPYSLSSPRLATSSGPYIWCVGFSKFYSSNYRHTFSTKVFKAASKSQYNIQGLADGLLTLSHALVRSSVLKDP